MMKKKDLDNNSVTLEAAIDKLIKDSTTKPRKFIETVDVAVNLSVDAKQSNQMVKGSFVLPAGSGKKVKVIVLAADEATQKEAIAAGAVEAGLEELVAKIDKGFLDFDTVIATPDVMQKVSKVARKLGPRGLMPSPKNGTVTKDVKKAIADALKGRVDYRNDKAGIVHCLAGKINFKKEDLLLNIKAIAKSIKDAKPEGTKGKYIKNFYLNTTMGNSIEVSVDSL
jgi:large subunit ribosomal protein L1